MANISSNSRYDPITSLVDDLFNGFLVRPVVQGELPQRAAQRLRLDITETGGAYRVSAELPGVRKEDIQLTIEGAQVNLAAEVKREREVSQEERLLHAERQIGRYARSFTLPQEIDQSGVEAKFRDGVLDLVLPKRAENSARRIEIH